MTTDRDQGEQFELIPALTQVREEAAVATARTRARDAAAPETAAEDPVAHVLVDVPLAHLDRPFDYLVPASMAERAVPGVRVKVRFAGQDVDGFLLSRSPASDHAGRLTPLRRVLGAEPVLSPAVARLSALVADRYAGSRADVLRLAVPPRHATAERSTSRAAPAVLEDEGATTWWGRYPTGPAFAGALAEGARPRAVWTALPGEDWARGLALAASATLRSGRGSILCVPDQRDLTRLDTALSQVLGEGRHVLLTADLGPAARYRSFLAVSRGAVRVVAGTRAAAFAPVHSLGLVALWDDGDDLYAEPRAPYPHTREVLLLRAHEEGTAALVAATARSVEAAALLSAGWVHEIAAPRDLVREHAPTVSITGATDRELARDPAARSARIPSTAHRAIREALGSGPVLVQTPRSGYTGSLVCEECREPARCAACTGPLRLPSPHLPPTCRWCGAQERDRACPSCGGRGLRAPVVGDLRTAEAGRAFPRVPVRRSSGDRVLDTVPDEPALVVATPGAEPVADDGYAAVVLLDTWLMLARLDLRTAEESVRRWLNAAALARSSRRGGRVVVVGDPAHPALQALVRWDPAGFAAREAEERSGAHLPPASRLAVVSGPEEAVTDALGRLELPPGAEVLGPTAHDPGEVRAVVRVPRRSGPALSRTLLATQGVRSARKLPPVRVQVDPAVLG